MIRIITGPTGSGKSVLAEELALVERVPLINMDAFQFYREIPILTNQPREAKVEYGYMGDRSIADPINAGEFASLMSTCMGNSAIWVGTGLYLGAALFGLDKVGEKGTPFQTGPRASFKMLVLDPNREELYQKLDQRVDHMVKVGALDEAKAIYEMVLAGQVADSNPVLKAIGLQHLLAYLKEESDWEDTLRVWKRDTRRLAKRQWTWLRKFCAPADHIHWAKPSEIEAESKWLIA